MFIYSNTTTVVERGQLEHAIAEVRRKFLDGLIDKIIFLEGISDQIRRNGAETSDLLQISAVLHRTAGLAPSLGFDRVGQESAKIESLIEIGLDGSSVEQVWGAVDEPLEGLLVQLESLLDLSE